jgi:hypothetical protein
MSDRESLLLALVLLYLVECLFWVKKGAWVFRTWLGRFWNYRADSEFARNDHGGVHWAWPLPPLGDVFVCRGMPISFGPLGVLVFKAERLNESGRAVQSARFVPWAEVRSVELRGKKVFIGGELFWAGDLVQTSMRLILWLREMAALPSEKREARLRAAVEAQYDVDAFKRRRAELQLETGWLDSLCPAFAIYLLVVMPMVVAFMGWLPALFVLLPVMYGLSGVIGWRFAKAHRRLFPDASEERFKQTLVYVLAPASTARARDPLTRAALEAFHPVCGAAVLLTPGAFREVSKGLWRDLQYPQLPECGSKDPDAVETERWYRTACQGVFRGVLDRAQLNPEEWVRPPKPSEAVNVQYCPRCHSQFTQTATSCAECGGRALLHL